MIGNYRPVRLTVIGSSPAWPNPGSAQSGYLLQRQGGEGGLLLDCGPGVLARLREWGRLSDVAAVAVTHFHLDHWGDLVPWVWFSDYGARNGRHMPDLWVPPGGRDELGRFAERWGNEGMFDRCFAIREYQPETTFEAGGLEIVALPVVHYRMQAFGFRVREEETVLAYSGDAAPGEELERLARRADLFLCEATLERGDLDGQPRGHLSAEEALAVADGPVLLTHRPIELSAPAGVRVATDGLSVEV
jgi:ribonuclease BN (tRNA processing enzyme)